MQISFSLTLLPEVCYLSFGKYSSRTPKQAEKACEAAKKLISKDFIKKQC